jgi:hypothetical protein
MNRSVAEIVTLGLMIGGHSGLCTVGCGCKLGDLFSCNNTGVQNCLPGWVHPCGTCDNMECAYNTKGTGLTEQVINAVICEKAVDADGDNAV